MPLEIPLLRDLPGYPSERAQRSSVGGIIWHAKHVPKHPRQPRRITARAAGALGGNRRRRLLTRAPHDSDRADEATMLGLLPGQRRRPAFAGRPTRARIAQDAPKRG